MSREIKFRLWNELAHEMLDWEFLCSRKWEMRVFQTPTANFLMQFTGLKDCNGKEIFEGDIVKFTNTFQVEETRAVEFPRDYGFITCYTFEIIGNVFENPELLPTKEKE